ncbi:uncharacterized protein LOC144446578 [Glandiceps talaboti]
MADQGNSTNSTNSTINTTDITELVQQSPGAVEAILAVILIIIIMFALVGNFFVLIVFGKIGRLRTPGPMFFVVLIAIAQIIAVLFSLIPTLVSVIAEKWLMGDIFCYVSAYVTNLCYHLNIHTLGLICFERYLRICRPLKHEEIFSETVAVIVVFGIVFFDCVLAVFPLVGWGEYEYLPMEYRCLMSALGWQKQVSHLHFTFVMTLVIPVLFSLGCLTLIVLRVREHRRVGIQGESKKKTKDSYGDRVRRSQDKMKRRILRKKLKMSLTEKETGERLKEEKEARKMAELSDSSSSEDEDSAPLGHRKYVRARNVARKVRYRAYEVAMTRTIFWTWVLIFLCWFPYYVCKYIETYETAPMPQGILVLSVWITFLVNALTPIVYLADNRRLRFGFLEVVGKKQKGSLDHTDTDLADNEKGNAYKAGKGQQSETGEDLPPRPPSES